MPDYTLIPREMPCGDVTPACMPAPACQKPYAMAYVQPQRWETVMCAEDALGSGTAFRSLVMPFLGKEAVRC